MSSPLGNPTQRTPITVTDVVQTLTVTHGLTSLELQNTGQKDCYFGSSSVTSSNGSIIFSGGDRKSWESLPSNWQVSVVCKSNEQTILRRVDYV